MSIAESVDRLLRRNPRVPRLQWLRNRLRKPYHRILASGGRGMRMLVGGKVEVRMPVEFCAREIEGYEPETVGAIRDWVKAHPGGQFVDIGCSYGYLSCAVGFLDPTAEILAIDADLESIAVTQKVCRYVPNQGDLRLLLALVGPEGNGAAGIEDVAAQTELMMAKRAPEGTAEKTSYVNLDTAIPAEELPRTSLDDLLVEGLKESGRPCLVKCDVEGGEELVLRGAGALLNLPNVTLLLSVHPEHLPRFNGSVSGVRERLEAAGYAYEILAIDHEEHWLCTRPT